MPPKGFFSKIPCPVQGCHAPDCMFAHVEDSNGTPTPPTLPTEPAIKRRRLGGELTKQDLDAAFAPHPKKALSEKPEHAATTPTKTPSAPSPPVSDDASEQSSSESSVADEKPGGAYKELATKDISPPPARRNEAATPTIHAITQSTAKSPVKEELNPRPLSHPPAGHATRYLYLAKLHEAMKALNDKLRTTEKAGDAKAALSDALLITKALDEEVKIATETPSVYPNVLKQTLLSYKKMDVVQWLNAISPVRKSADTNTAANTTPPPISGERPLASGLSEGLDRQILSRLLARQDGLEGFGYVTTVPSKTEMDEARAGAEASAGYETCERCKSRFQVFPVKREDGLSTSGGECLYHHGRIAKADRSSEKVQTCCNEVLGASLGCTTSDTHVFKVYDPKRLASLVPFECTPDNAVLDNDRAVTFDCEMGFTTNGMELIRLTALSWPKGEMLLDILVQPLGAVLDLNTKYSGINSEQLLKARPYDHSKQPNAQRGLRIVKSVLYARKLLFSLLTPSTPLIGHAIENDLNATRIVHPCIVDTVLLCPHSAGRLPYRRSLKALSQDYLWRTIQTAGAQGHDSMEDARATGDIVREMVKRAWFKMKKNGWQLQDEKLVPPSPNSRPAGTLSAPPQNRFEVHLRREAEKGADTHRLKEQAQLTPEAFGEKRAYDDLDDLITVEMNYD